MKSSVAIVGSANQDLTSYTPVVPLMGETVTGSNFETMPGGKGANQACAAASLGLAPVTMVSRVGEDSFGRDLLKNFKAKGVQFDKDLTILKEKDGKKVSTGIASIIVDTNSGDNCIIVTPGANHAMSGDDVTKSLKAMPEPPSVVVTQLEILTEAALAAMKTGKEMGAITILNPAPAPEASALKDFYPYCDIIIPNETELYKICGVSEAEGKDAEEKLARDLFQKGVGKAVVVTLGARGAMVVAKSDKETDGYKTTLVSAPDDLPCRDDPIVDTIGAGDGFCGALATYLSVGVELEDAAKLACGFAGMSVRRQGPSYPSPDEIPDCLIVGKALQTS